MSEIESNRDKVIEKLEKRSVMKGSLTTELDQCLHTLDGLGIPSDSYVIVGRAAAIANGVDIEFTKPLQVLVEPKIFGDLVTDNDFIFKHCLIEGISVYYDYHDNRIILFQSLPFSPMIPLYEWFEKSIIIDGHRYLSGGYRNENLIDYYFDLFTFTQNKKYKEILDKINENR